MISCLSNFIGIQGVTGYDNPDSGVFVNGLQGISTDILDDIRQDEDYDLQNAWQDILNRSIRRLEGDINIWASKYYLNYSYMSNSITGNYDDNTVLGTSTNYNGWYFDFWTYSKNLSLNISSIDLYSSTATDSDIRIYDANTGDLLYEKDHSFTVGINKIFINQSFPLWKYPHLFVCYDQSEISTIKAKQFNRGTLDTVSARSVSKSSSVVKDSLNASDTGLIVTYSLDCSIDNFVCNRRELFLESFWYLLGVEFCNERLFSDRVNRYTLLNRDEAFELRDQLKIDYAEKLNSILKGLQIQDDGICFECNKAVNFRKFLP